ncbi:hypothetical protein HED63_22300 [Ochrobactrum cytisi]|nr:hypothetical protein [Brucella cytisi]
MHLLCKTLGITPRRYESGQHFGKRHRCTSGTTCAIGVPGLRQWSSELAHHGQRRRAALTTLVARLMDRGVQAREGDSLRGAAYVTQPDFAQAFLRRARVMQVRGAAFRRITDKPPVIGACALARRATGTLCDFIERKEVENELSFNDCTAAAATRRSVSVIETELKQLDLALLRKVHLAVTGIGASYEAAVVTAGELLRRGRRAMAWHAVDLMQRVTPPMRSSHFRGEATA